MDDAARAVVRGPAGDLHRRVVVNTAPAGAVVRPVTVPRVEDRIPVWVEVDYSDGSHRRVAGVCTAWCPSAVDVQWFDRSNSSTYWVWMPPTAVTRRGPEPVAAVESWWEPSGRGGVTSPAEGAGAESAGAEGAGAGDPGPGVQPEPATRRA